jgi:hypothetical protein
MESSFPDLLSLYLRSKSSVIVLSQDLQANPRAILDQVCASVGLEFSDEMLHWGKGPKSFDGVWAV